MRSHLRLAAFSVLAASALIGALASPASAESVVVTDATADVVDGTGAPTVEPTVDITEVTLTNERDGLQALVDVVTGVAFTDPRWTSGSLTIEVFLGDPTNMTPGGLYRWSVDVSGSPVGIIEDITGDVLCTTDVSIDAPVTDGVYRFGADAACAAGLPRDLQVQAVAEWDGRGPNDGRDEAPDDDFSDTVSAGANGEVVRLAGTDRILTAIHVSEDDFAAGAADAVVLASAYGFPDALAGGPLAFARNAPMLLTAAEALDARTLDEIERVLAPGGTVYLLGGTAALAPNVQTAITAAGFTAARVAGADRFATAVAIADEIGSHSTVLVADGRAFTDALIAGAAAPSVDGIVLLTDGTAMPAATGAYLRADGGDQYAIGTNAAAAAGAGIDSFVAANASALSVLVAQELTTVRGAIAVASSASYPDSLAGGPHIARLGGALLLTVPTTLSPESGAAIEDLNGRLREVVVYGGTAAVSDDVERDVVAAL